MFGHRPDGKVLKNIDPMIAITPYLMPMRCDAQVMLDLKADYEKLARYITAKGAEGHKITFTELVIAAFVRVIAELPEVNRFIANKRIYARTELAVSFALLKDTGDPDTIEENTIKAKFNPTDTIFDVSNKIKSMIAENRREEADNLTIKLTRLLLNPYLAKTIVAIAKFLDRYGILPKFLMDALPFYTSMFLTNMASIGMPAVKHHIYNFGTTSLFISIGAVERSMVPGPDGKPTRKRMLPFGIVADERICAGAVYAKMVARFNELMNNPALLEEVPQNVRFEENNVYDANGKVKKHKVKKISDSTVSA